MKLTHRICMAGLLVIGTHGASLADEVLEQKVNVLPIEAPTPVSETLEQVAPLVTGSVVAVLPPRRPKSLVAAKPTQARPLAVVPAAREYRVAQVATAARAQPLFWMTVGHGF